MFLWISMTVFYLKPAVFCLPFLSWLSLSQVFPPTFPPEGPETTNNKGPDFPTSSAFLWCWKRSALFDQSSKMSAHFVLSFRSFRENKLAAEQPIWGDSPASAALSGHILLSPCESWRLLSDGGAECEIWQRDDTGTRSADQLQFASASVSSASRLPSIKGRL